MVQSPACDIAPQVTGDGGTMTGAGTQTAPATEADFRLRATVRPGPRGITDPTSSEPELRLQETQITKCGCSASFQTGS
jgi:hypothetical protein